MERRKQKFIKLSNGQWLKILFIQWKRKEEPISICWTMSIALANTKRKCNDCLNKTEKSPKVLYGRSTGNKLGLEPFKIALKYLHELEKTVSNCGIQIIPASKKLEKIYSYLKRFGYTDLIVVDNKNKNKLTFYKEV